VRRDGFNRAASLQNEGEASVGGEGEAKRRGGYSQVDETKQKEEARTMKQRGPYDEKRKK
jgi:hypothetical protein